VRKIKKAIIITAGFGTRFLPISKTIQKEMLPIIDKPIIDYIVDDCVRAGIEEIILVINEHNYQVMHYFQNNPRLYKYLEKMGKTQQYDKVANIHSKAKFVFVKQKDKDQYGTAVPVKLAQKHVEKEDAFLVLSGDDFIYHNNGKNEIKTMIDLYEKNKCQGVITCIEKQESELHRYGIAKVKKDKDVWVLTNLVEKPAPGSAPSNLANISKYIFTPEIFKIIDKQELNPQSGELYVTDSILTMAKSKRVLVHIAQGEYLDGGNPASWLKANLTVAKNRPEIWEKLGVRM
jgi:UTP--glucose-1-phosphate uridylyltransferase